MHHYWLAMCAELDEQKEAKVRREGSPWAEEQQTHTAYPAPSATVRDDAEIDIEQDEAASEGETGYYETAQDSAFQFEPPRAPAHYGASRNSPSDDPSRLGSYSSWDPSAGWPICLPTACAVIAAGAAAALLPSCCSLLSVNQHRKHVRLPNKNNCWVLVVS